MGTESKTMATVAVESGDGLVQKIRAGKHQLIADEPESNGGKDSGPAPYQLLLGGLGACTSATLKMYAQRKTWDLGTVSVRLQISRDEAGAERIERTISRSATLTQEQKDKLLEIAGKTPVTKTVLRGTPIETKLG